MLSCSATAVSAPRLRLSRLLCVDHSMQVSSRLLDITMFILPCSTLRGKYGTAMDVHEIAIRELISFFDFLRFLIIDPKMPFCIFAKSMLLDERIFLLGGRLMFTPCVPFVPHNVIFAHQRLSMAESCLV